MPTGVPTPDSILWLSHGQKSVQHKRSPSRSPHLQGTRKHFVQNTGWNEEMATPLPQLVCAPLEWTTPRNNVLATLPKPLAVSRPATAKSRSGANQSSTFGVVQVQQHSAPYGIGHFSTLALPRPSTAAKERFYGQALGRQPFFNAHHHASVNANPHAMASSRAAPGLPPKVPHARPRTWLLSAEAVEAPGPFRTRDDNAIRAAAVATLNRGVGIQAANEYRWHSRPRISQVIMC